MNYLDMPVGVPVSEGGLTTYQEPPTRLEMAISLLTKQGTSDAVGVVHARSIRIPTIENMTIDALAQYSGLSANKVICQLLEVALDEVFQGMSDQHRSEIFAIRGKLLKALPRDKDGYPQLGGENSKEGDI